LNRTFAFAKVHGYEKAISEAEKLSLNDHSLYHSLLGYLYSRIDADRSISHYQQSIALTKSKSEKETLVKELRRLEERRSY
jgi:RNA polymerase sigma-70 factor (ECF subfamily)